MARLRIRNVRTLASGLAASIVFALAGDLPARAQTKPVVQVSTAADLQAAVGNAAYAGHEIDVAAGTYFVTAKLVLQQDMDLVGHHASDTILDFTNLQGNGSSAPGGAVQIGLNNRVAKLTVQNTVAVGQLIDVLLLPSSGPGSATVEDSVVSGGQRGIRCRYSQGTTGRSSTVVLNRNECKNMSAAAGFGFGIQIQQPVLTNCTWTVTLNHNHCHDNRFGLFAEGNGASGCKFYVTSNGNTFENNEVGVFVNPGRPQGTAGTNNELWFTSIGDSVFNNVGVPSFGGRGGGIVAIAGLRTPATGPQCSNDRMHLSFTGTQLEGNHPAAGGARQDLTVFGAFSQGGTTEVGTGDTADVSICCASVLDGASGTFVAGNDNFSPADASNVVTIFGSNVALDDPSGAPIPGVPPNPAFAMHCPSDIAASTSDPTGALVTFASPTVDGCDSSPAATCAPASGSLFPLGLTTVNCAASDACGDAATCSFHVTVRGASAIAWSPPADIVYGTALSLAAQLNATASFGGASVPGTFAYTPAAGTVLEAGVGRTLSVSFTPTDGTK